MKFIYNKVIILACYLLLSQANANISIKFESIDSKLGRIAFGYVNKNIATNFDSTGNFQSIYWKDVYGKIISNKAYIYESKIKNSRYISFCVKSENVKCSKYNQVNKIQPRIKSSSSNISKLLVRILEPEKLSENVEPISLTEFELLKGSSAFIYTEHLDQNGRILDSQIVKTVQKTYLQGKPLTNETTKLQACSVGGFVSGDPTYIEACSPIYNVGSSLPTDVDRIILSYEVQAEIINIVRDRPGVKGLHPIKMGKTYLTYTPNWYRGYQDIDIQGYTYRFLAANGTNCNYEVTYSKKPNGNPVMIVTKTNFGCSPLGTLPRIR